MNRRTALLALLALALVGQLTLAASADERHRIINEKTPGQPVDITKFIVKGKINIFDFYSKYCPPCMAIAPYLEKLAAKDPNVVINKIDINRPDVKGIDWSGPCAKAYHLESIPHFVIYDATGKKVAEGKDAYKQVVQMLKKAGVAN